MKYFIISQWSLITAELSKLNYICIAQATLAAYYSLKVCARAHPMSMCHYGSVSMPSHLHNFLTWCILNHQSFPTAKLKDPRRIHVNEIMLIFRYFVMWVLFRDTQQGIHLSIFLTYHSNIAWIYCTREYFIPSQRSWRITIPGLSEVNSRHCNLLPSTWLGDELNCQVSHNLCSHVAHVK